MKKSLLIASLAAISMNVLGMNNRDIDRGNYSGAHLREITNLNNIEASTSSQKRARDDSEPQRSAQRRRLSSTSNRIQISDDAKKKINNYVEKYKSYNSRRFDKDLVKKVLIEILTEPNKTIKEIAKEDGISRQRVEYWIRKAGLSSERKSLINSYRESKLRLAKSILEYPEKGLNAAAEDNDVSLTILSTALGKLSDEGDIIIKKRREENAARQKKLDLLAAYYEGKDLEDLYEIFNKNEKETKKVLGEMVYLTLTEEEVKQLLTEHSGLIQDNREGLLNQKGRIDKWRVSEVKDYLVLHIARKLAIKIKENPDIEEAAWWSEELDPTRKGGDWWHHERELEYKAQKEVPEEVRKDIILTYNRGDLTRKGIAQLYKTKTSVVVNILDWRNIPTNIVMNKRIGRGDLEEVTFDLLTKSPDEVRTKYGYSDRTIRDRLVVIDHWRKLTDDQKNAFKKAIETKEMPDLSAVEDSKVKKSLYINENFRKYLFVLTATDEEIIDKYFKNIKDKQNSVGKLRRNVTMWTILAKHEVDLIKAVKDDDLEKVKDLIKKKTDVNCKDKYSQTPLMWATTVGNAGIVRYPINHGANISHKDKNDETALIIAENFGHDEIVNILRTAR
ncbi:MAG: ankyrin repeat domain-containing protein [Alphaproteobacteria bacterium]|nr:ankyrin repeat domain-containing protein [Alphaproteobacteria bacterium]